MVNGKKEKISIQLRSNAVFPYLIYSNQRDASKYSDTRDDGFNHVHEFVFRMDGQ